MSKKEQVIEDEEELLRKVDIHCLDELAEEIRNRLEKGEFIEGKKVQTRKDFHTYFSQYQRCYQNIFLANRREDILSKTFGRKMLELASMEKYLLENDKKSPVILLFLMQGYGDFFMMSRCFKYLTKKCHRLILCVYDPKPEDWVRSLSTLLHDETMNKITIIPQDREIIKKVIDENNIKCLGQTCDIYSLYHALGKTPLDIGFNSEPYLRVNYPQTSTTVFHRVILNEELKEEYIPFKIDTSKFNIGIFFKTTSNYERKYGGKDVSEKFFDPLLSLENTQLFSLQRELTNDEKQCVVGMNPKIIRFKEICEEQCFINSCHLIDRMDLVISVDSAICHIVGGKGHPKCFTLIPGLKRSICDRWQFKYDRKKKKKEKWWYQNMTKYFGIAGKFSAMGRYRVESIDESRAELLKNDVVKLYKKKIYGGKI